MKKTIAFHTLGCKVNQYDTQAMRELFEAAGYAVADFRGEADIYLVNTCTVTGTGDAKSLKLLRRIHREHEGADIIVCGCLAQRDAKKLMLPGVRLVLGVKHRASVVPLYERAVSRGMCCDAVSEGGEWHFEPLSVNRHEGRTRAVMKIQEGCDRYCAYCIIPSVRGPLRYMPVEAVRSEAQRLVSRGYAEIVVTGIHLASYGRGIAGEGHSESPIASTLLDAIRAVHDVDGLMRVRLGSLEPPLITESFAQSLGALEKLCPQFHLSMQSGSDSVLRRMRRRYDAQGYWDAVSRLREVFPGCAITTDVLTGFPGETDEEAIETLSFVQRVGFARIHVFPYSRREGTAANEMPDQVPEQTKRERAAVLTALGNQLEAQFVKGLLGRRVQVLMEERMSDGLCAGYSPEYVKVVARGVPGEIAGVEIVRTERDTAYGKDADLR